MLKFSRTRALEIYPYHAGLGSSSNVLPPAM